MYMCNTEWSPGGVRVARIEIPISTSSDDVERILARRATGGHTASADLVGLMLK